MIAVYSKTALYFVGLTYKLYY